MVDEENETSSWVSSVFKPKYSLDDFFEQEDNDAKQQSRALSENYFTDLYRKHCEELTNSSGTGNDEQSHRKPVSVTEIETGPKAESQIRDSVDKKQVEAANSDNGPLLRDKPVGNYDPSKNNLQQHLWTKEELKLFRTSHNALKKKAVDLLLLLSMSRTEIGELKRKCRRKDSVLKRQSEKLSDLEKANKKLCITCRELKEDVQFYKSKIKTTEEENSGLKQTVILLKKQLQEEKTKYNQERMLRQELDEIVLNDQMDARLKLEEQDISLRMKYDTELEAKNREIERVTEEFRREKESHKITKMGLEMLKKHFADENASHEGLGKGTYHFLNVVDIGP